MKCKRRSYLTEAIQWNGKNKQDIIQFCNIHYKASTPEIIFIFTGKKVEPVKIGQYIIKGKEFLAILSEEEFNKKYKEV